MESRHQPARRAIEERRADIAQSLKRSVLVLALAGGLAGAACTVAFAALAPRPTLKVAVVPATVQRHHRFQVTITVTYDPRAMRTPYLIAFLQFDGNACKATAKAEHALPSGLRALDFAGSAPGPKFTRSDNWTAEGKGRRRVCAYLYSKPVSLHSKAKPLLTASAAYREV